MNFSDIKQNIQITNPEKDIWIVKVIGRISYFAHFLEYCKKNGAKYSKEKDGLVFSYDPIDILSKFEYIKKKMGRPKKSTNKKKPEPEKKKDPLFFREDGKVINLHSRVKYRNSEGKIVIGTVANIVEVGGIQKNFFIEGDVNEAGGRNIYNMKDLVEINPKEPEKTEEYKYHLTSRPFDIGTYHKEYFLRHEEDETRFGLIVYSKPLPIKEMEHYSFAPITELEEYDNTQIIYYEDFKANINIVKNDRGIYFVKAEMLDHAGDISDEETMSGIDFLKNIESGGYIISEQTKEPEKPEPGEQKKFNNAQDYINWIETEFDVKFIDKSENQIIGYLNYLQKKQILSPLDQSASKKDRIDKLAQMMIYGYVKNISDEKLSLEQYAIKKFIGSAHTEAMMLSKALWVDVDSYKATWEALKKEKPVEKETVKEKIEPEKIDWDFTPHDDWRNHLIKARVYAGALKINFSGMELSEIVQAIDDKLKEKPEPEKSGKSLTEEEIKIFNEFKEWRYTKPELEGGSFSSQWLLYKAQNHPDISDERARFILENEWKVQSKPEETENINLDAGSYGDPEKLNRAIEQLLDIYPDKKIEEWSTDEKKFIIFYSGYGGIKGASGKGILYEYYTPEQIVKKMWGLAYKHGFDDGSVIETSCGVGRFFKFAPKNSEIVGYETNPYSARIAKILYPRLKINIIDGKQLDKAYFEQVFIKNNYTIRNKIDGLEKFDLNIGNPPYGVMGGKYAGMGEQSYTKAKNYIEYFLIRGLDIVKSGGLLIYIIGVEVSGGGKPFLQQGMTKAKEIIMERADLIDAYRLPNGLFERTDVLTDIVVFRKKDI